MTVLQLGDGSTATIVAPPHVSIEAVRPPARGVAPVVAQAAEDVAPVPVYMPLSASGVNPANFPFTTAVSTWTVRHGRNRYPLVQLIDATGEQIDADVDYPDLNTVVVTHAQPLAGSVLLI